MHGFLHPQPCFSMALSSRQYAWSAVVASNPSGLLQALKILSRKRCNRQQFGQDGIAAVLEHLAATSLTKRAAAEAANVILNVCYEKSNVELVLELGGIQKLVKLLADRDPDVQANAAGAIQSICFQVRLVCKLPCMHVLVLQAYILRTLLRQSVAGTHSRVCTCCTPEKLCCICWQESGRHGVREAGAVTPLVQLLDSPQCKVQARAVGALHNLSSDSNSIRLIRRGGGIPKLVHLLRWGRLVLDLCPVRTATHTCTALSAGMDRGRIAGLSCPQTTCWPY